MSLSKLDFNSQEEKDTVEEIFKNAVMCLTEEDRNLPAIEFMLPLLQRRIAVHHSGQLPLIKELVEILFQEGLVKALFATETPLEARQSTLLALQELEKRYPHGFQKLHPVKDMGIEETELVELVNQIENLENKMSAHPLHKV